MSNTCSCSHKWPQHVKRGNGKAPCLVLGCRCENFQPKQRRIGKVTPVSKYCQDTPPLDYAPSRDPEPLRW